MPYKIEVFCDNDLNANTYVVYDEISCIVIDPANDEKFLEKFIGNRQVLGVFLTHGHYDHFKGLNAFLKKYPVKCYMHKSAYNKLLDPTLSYAATFKYPFPMVIDETLVHFLHDGMHLDFPSFTIKAWYTPGHTDCMMSYIIDNNLFSGDFLFHGSIGRTDLATSNKDKMYKAIMEIKSRKTNYLVYPGHGEATTLEDEKIHNLYLKEENIKLIFAD